jgi:hypothetical protein
MSATNYDSSLITKYRRDKAVYTFARDATIAQNNNTSLRTVGGGNNANTSQEVVAQKKIGACRCINPYSPQNTCTCGGTN